MKTPNLLQAGLMMGALMAAPAVMASGTLTLGSDNFTYSANGEAAGEFNVTGQAYTTYGANYASSAIVGAGFETFCLESGVNASFNTSYSYTTSQTTTGNSWNNSSQGAGLQLSAGAAWLYEQFALGDLASYDYSTASGTGPGTRNYSAGELQAAIWAFQGGQSVSGWPGGTIVGVNSSSTSNPFYNDAIAHFGSLSAEESANGANYDVAVLNLTCGSVVEQNQLVLTNAPTPTPDGGTTMLLLGMSLAGLSLAGLRRQKVVAVRA